MSLRNKKNVREKIVIVSCPDCNHTFSTRRLLVTKCSRCYNEFKTDLSKYDN